MNTAIPVPDPERQRLENQRQGIENWRLWGPYLAERAWGTVREDYSPDGTAWDYFSHDQARTRTYRWSEDGLGGICDQGQRLCFALALWNGRDPILKERAFGLTGNQGNHGEDVTEVYFYLDATPSHAYLKYLYKYPQAEFPYARLVAENGRRGRDWPPFGLLDSGVFADGRYFDVFVEYAKAGPEEIHIRISGCNRGPEAATLHLLPTLWFRNTWGWGGEETGKPELAAAAAPGSAWAVRAAHPELGEYRLCGREPAELLFTGNETNGRRLWGGTGATPYVKDAFHRYLIQGEAGAVNPERRGTKVAAHYLVTVPAGGERRIDLVLAAVAPAQPLSPGDRVFGERRAEADAFHARLLPPAADEHDRRILRQSVAGLIWSKQFFHYDVLRWLEGDCHPPPDGRENGRNRTPLTPTDPEPAPAGTVLRPARGGGNPADAVPCADHDGHKALGEFDHAMVELAATRLDRPAGGSGDRFRRLAPA